MKVLARMGVLALSLSVMSSAATAAVETFDNPLNGWTTDRRDPGSFAAVGGELQIGILGSQVLPDAQMFYNTQGKSTAVNTAFLGIDIFVDANWGNNSVYTGIWGVGRDATDAISAYSIVAYRQNIDASPAGFYSYDYILGGWNFLTAANTGWNSVSMTLTPGTGVSYAVNGTTVGFFNDSETLKFDSVIVNTKNFGQDYGVRMDNLTDAPPAVPLPAAAYAALPMLGALGLWRAKRRKA